MSTYLTADIRWFDTLNSTNDTCAELAAAGAPEGLVVAAHSQTAGRGQRGNTWASATGQNLTFSLLLRPSFLRVEEQFALSQAVAVALCRFVLLVAPRAKVAIKWPNDIYIGSDKVAGVLIENSFSSAQLEVSVVGIGINLNQRDFPAHLPNPTSLALHANEPIELQAALQRLLHELAHTYEQLRSGLRDALERDYLKRLYRLGQLARYRLPDGHEFDATMVGISPIGELMLQTPNGARRAFGFKEVAFVL